jgi:beta-glucuronidase
MFTPEIQDKALPMIRRMIERDKNHPSVIAWSLANEPYVSTDRAEAFFKAMARTARQADPTRPITYVAHVEVSDNRGFPYYDFVCLNKYYGWYINHSRIDETLEGFEQCLDEYYQAFGKPMVLSEFGADAVAGLHTYPPQPFSEEFQSEMVRKQYELLRSKDYICGAHVWNFADFKTAHSLCRIINNRKGVFSRDRQPKMVAHTLRSLWTTPEQS